MKLETLLNGLIELWWEPRGREDDKDIIVLTWKYTSIRIWNNYNNWVLVRSLNDLCSIDSWLRQFVVEKGLYDNSPVNKYIEHTNVVDSETHEFIEWYNFMSDKYRLMLSAIQEDKEKFILDSMVLPTNKDK